jgi:hypothetical protein
MSRQIKIRELMWNQRRCSAVVRSWRRLCEQSLFHVKWLKRQTFSQWQLFHQEVQRIDKGTLLWKQKSKSRAIKNFQFVRLFNQFHRQQMKEARITNKRMIVKAAFYTWMKQKQSANHKRESIENSLNQRFLLYPAWESWRFSLFHRRIAERKKKLVIQQWKFFSWRSKREKIASAIVKTGSAIYRLQEAFRGKYQLKENNSTSLSILLTDFSSFFFFFQFGIFSMIIA